MSDTWRRRRGEYVRVRRVPNTKKSKKDKSEVRISRLALKTMESRMASYSEEMKRIALNRVPTRPMTAKMERREKRKVKQREKDLFHNTDLAQIVRDFESLEITNPSDRGTTTTTPSDLADSIRRMSISSLSSLSDDKKSGTGVLRFCLQMNHMYFEAKKSAAEKARKQKKGPK